MLQVPFKKAVAIDWVTPLVTYVQREHSAAAAEEFKEDFQSLQSLRNEAVAVAATSDAGRSSLLSYHAQIVQMSPRLPLNANDLVVPFTWQDGFIKGKNAQQSNLNFECAGILWNLGALESQYGASEERKSDSGLKLACKHFQMSAGYFEHLKSQVLPLLAGQGMLTPDLSPSGVGLALHLMLGQAQACYYEMAVRMKTMKPSVLAKLAIQASVYMNQALEDSQGAALGGQLDASWAAHIEFQALSFEASAQWWQSLHVQVAAKEAGHGYAEEIARIKLSQAAVTKALEVGTANGMVAAVTGSCTELLGKLATNLAVSVADNRTVYLEVEPRSETLPSIVGASPVKPTPPDFGCFGAPAAAIAGAAAAAAAPRVRPLFPGLLPVPAMRAIESCRTKVATIVSEIEVEAKQATKDVKAALSAVGLPGSIAAQDEAAGFPEALWSRVVAVQEAGGPWALKKRSQEGAGLAARANELLVALQKNLEEEFARDDEFRGSVASGGGGSSPLPRTSRESASHFKTEVMRYGKLFSEAQVEDEEVRSRTEAPAFQDDLSMLGKGRHQLDGLLPRRDLLDDDAAVKASTADPGPLSRELMVLAGLLKRRDAVLAQLSSASSKVQADLLDEVLAFSTTTSSAADLPPPLTVSLPGGGYGGASRELESFLDESAVAPVETLQTQLKESVDQQPAVMVRVMDENGRFDAARLKDRVTLGRQKVVMDVERAVESFKEVDAQLAAGASFYADLVSRLQQLVQTVDGFVYAQGIVRKDMEQEALLQQQTQQERSSTVNQFDPSSFSSGSSTMASDAALARRLADELNMQPPTDSPTQVGNASKPAPAYPAPVPPPQYADPPAFSASSSPAAVSSAPPPFPTFASATAPAPPPPAYGDVSSSPSTAPADEGAVQRLLDMGFGRDVAKQALESNQNDEELALNQLLS